MRPGWNGPLQLLISGMEYLSFIIPRASLCCQAKPGFSDLGVLPGLRTKMWKSWLVTVLAPHSPREIISSPHVRAH